MKKLLSIAAVIAIATVMTVTGITAKDAETAGSPGQKSEEKTETAAAPSADEQVAALEAMCAANADERAARHAKTPLFDRLGGEEGIHTLMKEVIRLHIENDKISYMFHDLDADKVAEHVALFVISGIGGPQVYDGPDLKTSHADMGLTNDDFMNAGVDVIQAMKNLGYGQEEIDEMVCILVSLRDQVVFADGGKKKASGY